MSTIDPDIAGWHLTYRQPTGDCYVVTVGLPDFDAAQAAAEQHGNFIPGDTLVGHGSLNRDALVREGGRPGAAVLTTP